MTGQVMVSIRIPRNLSRSIDNFCKREGKIKNTYLMKIIYEAHNKNVPENL